MGRAGEYTVRLEAVDEETLGEALTLAWQNIVAKKARGSIKKPRTVSRRKARA